MSLLDDPSYWLELLAQERPRGIQFIEILGHGKSAVVFKARAPDGSALAIKLYDHERLARFGLEVQAQRINRELSLKGHSCGDLVGVLDGGTLSVNGQQFPFVALEHIDGRDLRTRISKGRAPDAEIRQHLASLFRAVSFLDERDLCHRDIKSDNCRLRSNGALVLLDLGVLRPVASSDLTDDSDDPKTKYFLGTLRYAPPELLRRQEGSDRDSWRAISIYQVGTVLYELIHGVVLFSHVREPYAELVEAVLHGRPEVMRQDIGADLVNLTRACLVKDPKERLRLVPWPRFLEVANSASSIAESTVNLAERMRRTAELYAQTVEAKEELERQRRLQRKEAGELATRCVADALQIPSLKEVAQQPTKLRIQSGLVAVMAFPQNLKLGFPHPLWLCCRIIQHPQASESVRVEGVAFYGDLPLKTTKGTVQHAVAELGKVGAVLSASATQKYYEVLVDGPPSEGTDVLRVRAWAESIVNRYFDFTQVALSGLLKEETDRIGQSFHMSTRVAALYVLNSSEMWRVPPGALT